MTPEQRHQQAVEGLSRLGATEYYTGPELMAKFSSNIENVVRIAKVRGWRGYGYGKHKLYAKPDVDLYLAVRLEDKTPPGWVTLAEASKRTGATSATLYHYAYRNNWVTQYLLGGKTRSRLLLREVDVATYKPGGNRGTGRQKDYASGTPHPAAV